MVYLDNSATTRPSERVLQVMADAADTCFGNPSSLHHLGVQAEKLVKESRRTAAALLHASPEEVYFCSGGTEADNTALFGAYQARRKQGNKILTSQIEHPAVLEACKALEQQGAQVVYLPVDAQGFVRMDALEAELDDNTILVSIMHANNETGAVQPIEAIGALVREKSRALFHCDAVQSYGKLPIDVNAAHIDLLSASGHKIHGPKGVGIFYVRKGVHIPPFVHGGGQERGFRSGTENVPGIAGFAAAADEAGQAQPAHLEKVRAMSEQLLRRIQDEIGGISINSPVEESGDSPGWLPYIVNITFQNCRGEVLLHMLEQEEIYVSTGSACSSHKKGYSPVLLAMGRKEADAEGAIRFSLSHRNEPEEIDRAVDVLKRAVEAHRRMMGIARRMGR